MVNTSDFTKRLEKILEYFNLSAAAFAEEIDFNRSTISHLLSGRNKPSLEFVMKLCQKFPEVDMDWLLFGKGSFPTLSEKNDAKTVIENKQTIEKEPPSLFSEAYVTDKPKAANFNENKKEIERIVIFYKDGTFNTYQN
ncbi:MULTISPECIES: helix-turn-helix domain-containing protein [Aequorivita]|uniref:Helix-turn-helix transcriptional regulator n=1 Tax=Aequorivita iocasae TaxID=2803865 RepID=A0ABX7DPN1_9FLAO|nr:MULTISPECIES: helix-turn-helix transcriptional regulator [Aequorivita]QQX76101.1 helix-turn-helix transcriptional regulator [Aequorivita iocasae]UCA55561.1 helix-turn-helix transcriptional regulator [Aequorivita sp. F7]